jgi:signal transduction histidine kinase
MKPAGRPGRPTEPLIESIRVVAATGPKGMSWRELLAYLAPPRPEQLDPEFRRELEDLGRLGLAVLGGFQLGVPFIMVFARMFLTPRPWASTHWVLLPLLIVAVGALSLSLSRRAWAGPYAANMILGSVMLTAVLLTWSAMVDATPLQLLLTPARLGILILITVALAPVRPFQALLVGLACFALVPLLAGWANWSGANPPITIEPISYVYLLAPTLLGTVLAAVLYHRRLSHHRAHQRALQAVEQMQRAQTRAMLAESSAAVGRLAAALSHEFNSPLGVLSSAVDTLLGLAARQEGASAAERARLLQLQTELYRSVKDSGKRLHEIVARMQRFTNLERAEVQSTNLNELLGDVLTLHEPLLQRHDVQIDLRFEALGPILCRPEQISAVFASLLANAVEAVDGGGRIEIRTARVGAEVRVVIRDNGHGLSAGELTNIFYPEFKVQGGRVATGNWSLFSARQIIQEHGGEITIQSGADGTAVTVALPASLPVAAAG